MSQNDLDAKLQKKSLFLDYLQDFCIFAINMKTAQDIILQMEQMRNDKQRKVLMGFFKTAPGQYGEGDEFLGIKVPQTRSVVKSVARDFPLSEVPELLLSKWHEVRLCGFLILVWRFEFLSTTRLASDEDAIHQRDSLLQLYLRYAKQANNWDLVDLSAPKILGNWLLLPTHLGDKIKLVDRLALSDNLWCQRISMVCSWKTSQQGDPSWCLRYAEIHLHHPHDLMQKAVGWMLREMGKRVSLDLLRDFLRQHIHEMSRTTLRYAIEKMDEDERRYWMKRD
jgi:3-methyladenine DNA glycosylase AlkD